MNILLFGAAFALIALASKQVGQGLTKTGLPLISAFLLTGIISGPHMLGLIHPEAAVSLKFVDEISLGFIAFAAGAELYYCELRSRLKAIGWITSGLTLFTFPLAAGMLYVFAGHVPFMADMTPPARLAVCLLTGAILVARSPSSAIAIINELRAKGVFTQTVLGVTVISDVVVIVLFAGMSAAADALLAGLGMDFAFVFQLLAGIVGSLALGWFLSVVLQGMLRLRWHKVIKIAFVLLSGYLVFFMAEQMREFSHRVMKGEIWLEPLLICMVAGFRVANIGQFRKDFLSLLDDAGPPVYVAFFTLTGASLSLDVLITAWPAALGLFALRFLGIFMGAFLGGSLAGNSLKDNCVSWMAYITQAGVSLGLAKEVMVKFPVFGDSLGTVIIAVIVLNQLVGPPLFKLAIKLIKEDHPRADSSGLGLIRKAVIFGSDGQASALAMSLGSQGWQVMLAREAETMDPADPLPVAAVQVPGFGASDLKKVGCQRAGAIVAMLSDEKNYQICETAYENFGTQTLVARLSERANFQRFEKLGVLIVDPSTAIVGLLDHFVRSPAAASLFMGMNRERKIVDIMVKNPDLAGLALRDLRLPFDSIIMSVRRMGVLFVPHGFTRLEAGDLVTVVGSKSSIDELLLRFDVNSTQAVQQMVQRAAPVELTDGVASRTAERACTEEPERCPRPIFTDD